MKNILIEKIIQILIYVKQRFLMLHRKGIKGKKEMKSILRLDKVVFDKIEFNRLGFKNDTELKLEIQTNIEKEKIKQLIKLL